MELYYYWLIAAIVCVIIEIATVSFGAVCFSIGALASALVAYFEYSLSAQLGTFAAVSFLCFLFLRPVLLQILNGDLDVKTNADAIIGRKGIVSETIDATQHTGRVSIDGDDWKALAGNGEKIEVGTEVEVISRESLIITVKTII